MTGSELVPISSTTGAVKLLALVGKALAIPGKPLGWLWSHISGRDLRKNLKVEGIEVAAMAIDVNAELDIMKEHVNLLDDTVAGLIELLAVHERHEDAVGDETDTEVRLLKEAVAELGRRWRILGQDHKSLVGHHNTLATAHRSLLRRHESLMVGTPAWWTTTMAWWTTTAHWSGLTSSWQPTSPDLRESR